MRRTSKCRRHLPDEKVVFLSDILPTGWQAAVQCEIEPTDTVAIWGCGPVGQMAIRSAILLGAKQVIAIDQVPERLAMAQAGGAITINFEEESVLERLNDLTHGKGPEKCIDAVGMEAHASVPLEHIYDRVKQTVDAGNRPAARVARDGSMSAGRPECSRSRRLWRIDR